MDKVIKRSGVICQICSVPFKLLQLYCVVDAVMVVGNGRLLRSWDVNVGGLNWEVVLDSGR